MKTKNELNTLKEEVETLNKKLAELTEEELKQVAGGVGSSFSEYRFCKYCSATSLQVYAGTGTGWDVNKNPHSCYLWQCLSCRNTNYYDVSSGELI